MKNKLPAKEQRFNIFEWKKGEIIWVAAVVAGIITLSWRQLITGEQKTRDAQRKADVELVGRALNNYYADYQIYPPATASGQIVSCGTYGLNACQWGEDNIVDVDGVVYLKGLPKDPQSWKGLKYVYETNKDRTKYKIYVHLEYVGDVGYRRGLTQQCGDGVQCNWLTAND